MATGEMVTMASVQERVRERIQQTFMELLPEEIFQGLVKQQLDQFMRTELPKLVAEEGKKIVSKALAAEFAKPEWQQEWDMNQSAIESMTLGPRARELVLGIVKEAAPDLVAALFGGFAQNIVMDLRNRAQRGYQ